MSEKDERGPERPMLILGQDYPDVEDTTPEELRRQEERAREEIERKRREAQEEIERRRREAEREIAELEKQKARELRERERELERTQKKLYDRETQLLRKAGTKNGRSPGRVVPPPPKRPLRETGLRARPLAVSLAVVAVSTIIIGGLTGGDHVSDATLTEIDALDQARVHYLRSGLEVDEAIAARMAGDPSDDTVPGQASVEAALALAPDSDYYGEDILEQAEEMVDEDTGTVRALTLWEDASLDASVAVSSYEVERLYRDDVTGSAGSVTWIALGLAALLALIVMAVVARSWIPLGFLVIGGGLAVALIPMMTGGSTQDALEAIEAHQEADDVLDEVVDRVHDDLSVIYGTNSYRTMADTDYWDSRYYYADLDTQDPAVAAFVAARKAVPEAEGEEERFAAAVDVVATGRELFEAQAPAVEQARGEMISAMDTLTPRFASSLLGLGAGVWVVGGLLLSGGPRGRSS